MIIPQTPEQSIDPEPIHLPIRFHMISQAFCLVTAKAANNESKAGA